MKIAKLLSLGSIFTVTLLNSNVAFGQNMCPAKIYPVSDSVRVHQNDLGRAQIYDFYEHCLGVLSTMNSESRMAVDEWKHGNKERAVSRIKNALRKSVGNLYLNQSDIPPYTAQTLVAAHNISRVLEASLNKNIQRKYISLQVEFMTLTKLVELANWSYQYVDAPYYNDVVDTYLDSSFFSADFPMEYFKNVQDLSVKYIGILDQINIALADNGVELDVSYAFVRSVVGLINNSVYKRQFCSVKAHSTSILDLISRFRCGEISVPSRRQVDLIRAEIEMLKREIYSVNVGYRGC